MKNKILYIGGFEMPDKNAAAQRVLSIAKALREVGYTTEFYGISKSNDHQGVVDGFDYEAYSYPRNTKEWICYAKGDKIIEYIQRKSPKYVFTYNYPGIAQERVIKYCHMHGIKVVGDITEWYQPDSFFKKIDTTLRMRWSNKHLDGIIAISRYLANFYLHKHSLQLPPLIDIQEPKWKQVPQKLYPDKIKLIYAGQPSLSKDRLDYIVDGIAKISCDKILLHIVGVSKEEYQCLFGDKYDLAKLPIIFHGRLPHNDTVRLLLGADFQIFFRPNIRVNNAGFPTKFVEAMTAGIPVIMNKISNVDDYLTDGINGMMIPFPSEVEIHNVLKRVSELSRHDVDRMKENCDKNKFDYHNYSDTLLSFIKRL